MRLINTLKVRNASSKTSGLRKIRKASSAVFSVFRILLLMALSYVIMYPLFMMISGSFMTVQAFRDPSILWIPKHPTLHNYKMAYEVTNFWKALSSTFSLQIVSAAIEVITCSVTAYGLARFEFKLKKPLMIMLLLLVFLPTQMIIIPQMMNFSKLDFFGILGLISKLVGKELRPSILDTNWTFWLPSLFAVGLRSGMIIFIYYQFFKGLPKELEEAASIDGSGPLRTYIKIALPSSGVVILTVSVLSVVWHWNDYYLAVMYTSENHPLSVAIANLRQQLQTVGIWELEGGIVTYAGALLYIAPLLIAYMCVQHKFVKSIDRVGITG